jgi:hypothetical protein
MFGPDVSGAGAHGGRVGARACYRFAQRIVANRCTVRAPSHRCIAREPPQSCLARSVSLLGRRAEDKPHEVSIQKPHSFRSGNHNVLDKVMKFLTRCLCRPTPSAARRRRAPPGPHCSSRAFKFSAPSGPSPAAAAPAPPGPQGRPPRTRPARRASNGGSRRHSHRQPPGPRRWRPCAEAPPPPPPATTPGPPRLAMAGRCRASHRLAASPARPTPAPTAGLARAV